MLADEDDREPGRAFAGRAPGIDGAAHVSRQPFGDGFAIEDASGHAGISDAADDEGPV